MTSTFATSDLSLATILSLSFPIFGLDKANPSKVEFLFERTPLLEQTIEAYWQRELKVEPLSFFSQLRYMKSRIYQEE